MQLSIIIPMYNASGNITRCLESIFRLGMPNDSYEIICVDDCSTDDTIDVVSELQKHNSNLRIVRNNENCRAGGARNHGIREAKGEYCCFIDADDYYSPEVLPHALSQAVSNNLDILMCNSCREVEGGTPSAPVHNINDVSVMSGPDFLSANGIPLAPWKYIFRRRLMTDNEVWFVEKVSAEDGDWVCRLTLAAKRMAFYDRVLVHYVLTPESQTGTLSFRACYEVCLAARRMNSIYLSHKGHGEYAAKIQRIAQGLAKDGIKRMLQCYAPRDQKVDALNLLEGIHTGVSLPPNVTAILTNVFYPLIVTVVKAKRILKGRL